MGSLASANASIAGHRLSQQTAALGKHLLVQDGVGGQMGEEPRINYDEVQQ